MKRARNYLALAVLGCLALRLLVSLIAPLVPILIVALILTAIMARMFVGPRRPL
jgi:hypothetical protein